MCWMAYAPKDRSQIPGIHFQRAQARNDDGWGFMFPDDGQLRLVREMSNLEAFKSAWKTVPIKRPVAVHFRYGTSGTMDVSMTHPFPILEDANGVQLAMMHNGVLSCVGSTPTLSDTAILIRDVIKPQLEACPYLVEVAGWREAMGAIVGDDNKLLFMRADGQTFIVNAWQGEWVERSLWYSNLYSIEPPRAPIKVSTPLVASDVASFGRRAWDFEDGISDMRQDQRGTIIRAGEPLEAMFPAGIEEQEADYTMLPDLWELTETEIYNWLLENNFEDICDAIIEMRGGR